MANIAKINVSGLDYDIKDLIAHEHVENHDNPHLVTKEQVGLSNVQNLSPTQLLREYLSDNLINNALGYVPASALSLENKIDKFAGNQEVSAIINFIKGIKVGGALIQYDFLTDTITFK